MRRSSFFPSKSQISKIGLMVVFLACGATSIQAGLEEGFSEEPKHKAARTIQKAFRRYVARKQPEFEKLKSLVLFNGHYMMGSTRIIQLDLESIQKFSQTCKRGHDLFVVARRCRDGFTLDMGKVRKKDGETREELVVKFATFLERYQNVQKLEITNFDWDFFKGAVVILKKKSQGKEGKPFSFNALRDLKVTLSADKVKFSWKDVLGFMPHLTRLDLSENNTKLLSNFQTLRGRGVKKLTHLNLRGINTDISNINFFLMWSSAFLKVDLENLTHLDLSNNSMGPDGILLLSKMNFKKLTHLNLSRNLIDPDGIEALSRMNLKKLKHLSLKFNQEIGPAGMRAFAGLEMPELEHLVLSSTQMHASGLLSFAGMHLPNLSHLELEVNEIGSAGASAFSDMKLKLKKLKYLSLKHNYFGDEVMEALASIELPNLEHLDLSVNQIGDAGMKALAGMELPNLRHLDLSNNMIGDEGMESLAGMELPNLRYLDLSVNQIGDEGMEALAGMELPNLKCLDLGWCSISDAGVGELSKMNLSKLEMLTLYANRVGDAGVAALAGMELPNLENLSMGELFLSAETHALFKGNPNFPKLRELNSVGL